MWQKIETAPKDGREIFATAQPVGEACASYFVDVVHWDDGMGYWADREGLPVTRLEYWIEIPDIRGATCKATTLTG